MNPLDVVRRTPGTNCGACGYGTCLAFGVAVTRGGEALEKCPFLSSAGLPVAPSNGVGGGMDNVAYMGRERDTQLATALLQKIKELDFLALAPMVGGGTDATDPDCMVFSYLARTARICKDGITVDGHVPDDPRDLILLSNYLTQGGGPAPDNGNWVGMESLPNSISKVKALARDCETKIAAVFAKDPSALDACCTKLGGSPGNQGAGADVDRIIYVLPRIPMLLLFWAEDEEDGFGARAKVLFDERVLGIIDIESLVFAAERLADSLIHLASPSA